MDMTGVYACLFEAVCDVTTVPSHLKKLGQHDYQEIQLKINQEKARQDPGQVECLTP